jgi:hypothetical protein
VRRSASFPFHQSRTGVLCCRCDNLSFVFPVLFLPFFRRCLATPSVRCYLRCCCRSTRPGRSLTGASQVFPCPFLSNSSRGAILLITIVVLLPSSLSSLPFPVNALIALLATITRSSSCSLRCGNRPQHLFCSSRCYDPCNLFLRIYLLPLLSHSGAINEL